LQKNYAASGADPAHQKSGIAAQLEHNRNFPPQAPVLLYQGEDKPLNVMTVDPKTGKTKLTPAPGSEHATKFGASNRADVPTEAERKAAVNAVTMVQANDQIEKLSKAGKVTSLAFLSTIEHRGDGVLVAADKFGRNKALTPDEQSMYQAARAYLEGAGHLKSGARITMEQIRLLQDIYIPLPGDSPQVRKQKADMRAKEVEAAKIGGDRAWKAYEKAHPSTNTEAWSSKDEERLRELEAKHGSK
jgi:hypothetical protein